VRDRYNGDVVISLPGVDGSPTTPLMSPHLIADMIETNALRAASTTPIITVPALKPWSESSRDKAQTRRRYLYATWDYSAMVEAIMPRMYRHLVGYGTAGLMVVPDFDRSRARIEIRDPLTAYPEHKSPEDPSSPRDVAFVYGRSPQWIMAKFPKSREFFVDRAERRHVSGDWMDSLWDVVEWVDEDQVTMGVLGPRAHDEWLHEIEPPADGCHLDTWDNRAGMVPCAIPRRVTMDRIDSQVSKFIGTVDFLGKLTSLDVLATEKAIYPDMVVIDDQGTPQLFNASGRWNDGRTGDANLVKAKAVQLLQSSPGPMTQPILDRIERNVRMSGGMPGMIQGENTNSLRTGNALDTMHSLSVDPRITELQHLGQRALKTINEAVVELTKGYWPNKKQVFFSGWPGDLGHVEYTPAEDFEDHENAVNYSLPGTDVNELTVAVGQAIGTGLMSKKTGRYVHPLIGDPDAEEDNVTHEMIEEAAMTAFIQQAQTGQLPLIDLANIAEEAIKAGSWITAIQAADKKARERQAETPTAPTAPEAQPGLSMPGMGTEAAGEPSIPGASGAQMDLGTLLRNLNTSPSPS
jgi:hypothetical protein